MASTRYRQKPRSMRLPEKGLGTWRLGWSHPSAGAVGCANREVTGDPSGHQSPPCPRPSRSPSVPAWQDCHPLPDFPSLAGRSHQQRSACMHQGAVEDHHGVLRSSDGPRERLRAPPTSRRLPPHRVVERRTAQAKGAARKTAPGGKGNGGRFSLLNLDKPIAPPALAGR